MLQHIDHHERLCIHLSFGLSLIEKRPNALFIKRTKPQLLGSLKPWTLVKSNEVIKAQGVHLFKKTAVPTPHVNNLCTGLQISSQQASRLSQIGLGCWHFITTVKIDKVFSRRVGVHMIELTGFAKAKLSSSNGRAIAPQLIRYGIKCVG